MQGTEQTFGVVKAKQVVYNMAELFKTPRGGGSAQEINNLSTRQFREACQCGPVVDSLLQLPWQISDQFGVSTGNSDADTSRYGLEDDPEGKEDDEATEDEKNKSIVFLMLVALILMDLMEHCF